MESPNVTASDVLTSLVHHEVSGTKLVSVDVLDGDQVVGADLLLQVSILPHHIGCGLCGHDLHRNAEGTSRSTKERWDKSPTGETTTPRSSQGHPPVSRLELSGELGPFLLMFSLQVADGERDALLAVGCQASALRGGRGARR